LIKVDVSSCLGELPAVPTAKQKEAPEQQLKQVHQSVVHEPNPHISNR
jgi:hypothetical protein